MKVVNPSTSLAQRGITPYHAERERRAREARPRYFAQIDALVASGTFRIEDRRLTRDPTGRRYA